MAQQPLPLITFYQGWKTYQHHLVETIAPLSSAQLASPVAPHQEKQPAHDAAELVAAFESTWQMIEDALARWAWSAGGLWQRVTDPTSCATSVSRE